MQAARLMLGESAMSLADAAEAYLDIELNKIEQQSDWSAPNLTDAQLEYAALDAVVAFNLSKRVLHALGPQTPAYEIQVAVTPAVARMNRRGVRLNLDAHAEFIQSRQEKRIDVCAAYRSACVDMGLLDLAAKIPAKPTDKQAVLEAILTSDELASWKRTEKSGALSTARNELKRAAFRYPPIRALVELSKLDKMLAAFGPTLTALVSPITGRIHANCRVASTASGRA
jgi:DNA polymerase I